ncbi:DUF4349 domain-containing protein [Cohnella sp. LGH]|uniref:DUF4349 domain-containing protein n=1 Tax=Cohnella sp. LGH TaxID=1619153 RepID=UPI001ADC22BB|nr:DUF4349 domain-containing protein [Cohnella sp. LGH]QTH46106.1 DUF4349 domain-containing protein [Cohnella sp. LGH]
MKGNRIGVWSKGLLLVMAALLLAAGLAACSSSSKDSVSKSKMSTADQSAAAPEMESLTMSKEAAPAAAPSAAVQTTSASQAGSGGASSYSGGGIGPIADANAGYDRKVIYRAELVMKVKEFRAAEEQLMNQIHLSGAYVLQFSDSRNANEVGANFVIKVPSTGFSSFLEKMQQIDNLKFEREVQGSDVTEEFVDLEARLKTQQTLEARYLDFMNKATKTDDLVKFANPLAQVQETIEQIKGRMRYLDQNVAFSTVNLRLYQSDTEEIRKEEKKEKDFEDRISDALSGSANVLRQFGEGLLVVLAAMLPVLIVVAVLGIPTYYIVRKRGAARRKASLEKRKAWNRERQESGEAMESDEEAASENGTATETNDASSQDENR